MVCLTLKLIPVHISKQESLVIEAVQSWKDELREVRDDAYEGFRMVVLGLWCDHEAAAFRGGACLGETSLGDAEDQSSGEANLCSHERVRNGRAQRYRCNVSGNYHCHS